MRNNNRIIIDLNKAMYAKFGYRNQHGTYCSLKPPFTVNGTRFHPCDIVPVFNRTTSEWITATALEAAEHFGCVDIWTPECTIQLMANHSLTYTGEKAKSIWAEWCRRQFNKVKRK